MSVSGSADVVIIGAGVMGSATAFYLAERGRRVILLEQGRVGGMPSASGASGASAPSGRVSCHHGRGHPVRCSSAPE